MSSYLGQKKRQICHQQTVGMRYLKTMTQMSEYQAFVLLLQNSVFSQVALKSFKKDWYFNFVHVFIQ